MSIRSGRIRLASIPPVLLLLNACTALDSFLGPLGGESTAPVVAAVPLEEQPRLDPLNRNYFVLESAEQSVIGEPQVVFTREEDTFSDLAREYGLGYDELVDANPDVDPWLPGEGTAVLLPTQYVLPGQQRDGIVLNIAAKRLFYYPDVIEGEQQVVMSYPIGIGRVGWQTPLGNSEVISKARDPHWYVPASVRREHEELGDPLPAVVPPGPDNPLGRHVLKLDIPGYLIHGTNQPYGVGMRVSHGCVRLYPENIELLYELVGIGEPVSIVNEPFLVGQRNNVIFFEAHSPLEDDEVDVETRLVGALEDAEGRASEAGTMIDIAQLRTTADLSLGIPLSLNTGRADEVFARARVVRNTVEIDPDMPTIEEVREMLDEPLDDERAVIEETIAGQ